MSIIAKEEASFTKFVIPAGQYPARCVRVLDIGTHLGGPPGQEPKLQRKLRLTWEIPDVLVPRDDRDDYPAQITQTYTLSLHEKATLRALLASWRGRDFTPEELKGFDIAKLLGAKCLINIVVDAGKAKAKGNLPGQQPVTPLPSDRVVRETDTPLEEWSVENGKDATYEAFPDWLKATLAECKEWTSSAPVSTPAAPAAGAPDDDDMPF